MDGVDDKDMEYREEAAVDHKKEEVDLKVEVVSHML